MLKYQLNKDSLEHIASRLTNYLAQSKPLTFALDGQFYSLDNNQFLSTVFSMLRYPKDDAASWNTHIKQFKEVIKELDTDGYEVTLDVSNKVSRQSIFSVVKQTSPNINQSKQQDVLCNLCAVPIPDRMPLKTFYDGILEDVLPGLVVVMGPTFSGKTTFVRNEIKPDIILRYGEPFEDIDFQYNVVVHPTSFVEVLSDSIIFGVLGFKVAIDSLRSIIFSIGGPASSGGVRVLIYNLITNLSNLYSNLNITVVSVINPLVTDNDYQLLYSNIMSACSGVISIINQKVDASSYRKTSGRTTNVEVVPVDLGSDSTHRIFQGVAFPGVSSASSLSPFSVDTVDDDDEVNNQITF